MIDLLKKRCVPCEGGTPPLGEQQISEFKRDVDSSWEVIDGKRLRNKHVFKNFKTAMAFLNQVADLAEAEGHHPDFRLYDYKKVEIDLTTHAINGLSENDFIMAAKIDQLKHE